MKKFNKTYNKILNEYKWNEPFIGNIISNKVLYYKEESYLQLYKSLICEEYTIFPVPRKLMNNMLDYALNHDSLSEKKYTCCDILQKYILDWKYYNEFKDNIQLMLKNNINCSITLVLYNTFEDLMEILKKYPNENIQVEILNQHEQNELTNGIAYTYKDFNVCLAINCSVNDKFIIAKTIQHELIHWMQVSLNLETKNNYGKFKKVKFNLSPLDRMFLYNIAKGKDEIELINYLLNEFEFEPWVANTCEEFSKSGLTVDQYIQIIKDDNLFIDKINNTKNIGQQEMYIFGKICYICSNRQNENYWYYLIEALKEN